MLLLEVNDDPIIKPNLDSIFTHLMNLFQIHYVLLIIAGNADCCVYKCHKRIAIEPVKINREYQEYSLSLPASLAVDHRLVHQSQIENT